MNKIEVEFVINGTKIKRSIKPSLLLIDLIRDELSLQGTKPGCLEGECGACTVLVDGAAVNSCLYLAVNVNSKEITTIEGISNKKNLDVVQEALVEHGAVQCGFCTSGVAMSIKSFTDKYKAEGHVPLRDEIKKGLEGNICRCTGYVKIIDAAEAVLKKGKAE